MAKLSGKLTFIRNTKEKKEDFICLHIVFLSSVKILSANAYTKHDRRESSNMPNETITRGSSKY